MYGHLYGERKKKKRIEHREIDNPVIGEGKAQQTGGKLMRMKKEVIWLRFRRTEKPKAVQDDEEEK